MRIGVWRGGGGGDGEKYGWREMNAAARSLGRGVGLDAVSSGPWDGTDKPSVLAGAASCVRTPSPLIFLSRR